MPNKNQKAISVAAEREFNFTSEDFEDIAGRIYDLAGIVLKEQKKDMVYGRLSRRLRQLNLNSFAEYRRYLDSETGSEETQSLVNALTTNLTSLFREPHHFEFLHNVRLPELCRKNGNAKIRVWCAAASTGEEPYSIASVLADYGLSALSNDLKILATDLDTGVLAKAQEGIYPKAALAKVPERYRRYFLPHDAENITAAPALRAMLVFRQLNLLGNWPMKGPFDVIFCRNVLIYFDNETRRTIIERMLDLLPPGGILYLGHSESMPIGENRVISEAHTVYRKL